MTPSPPRRPCSFPGVPDEARPFRDARRARSPARGRRRRHVDLRQPAARRDRAEVRRRSSTTPGSTACATATVRLDGGCTGSFVSGDGLILTNHHCAEDCLAQNSSRGQDLVANGFLAGTREKELRVPGRRGSSVLVGTEDVTAKVAAALEGVAPDKASKRGAPTLTQLEQACEEARRRPRAARSSASASRCTRAASTGSTSTSATTDVRLVFAPERDIAAFGGDPDNFQFPRWCLDMSILRAYENGKPAKTPNHLNFNLDGAAAGRGGVRLRPSGRHGPPAHRCRSSKLQRDTSAVLAAALLGAPRPLHPVSKTGEEPRRIAESLPELGLENAIKVRRKQLDALLDDALIAQRRARKELRARSLGRGARARRSVGRHREGPGRLARHPRALRVHRERRRLQQPLFALRAHAGARAPPSAPSRTRRACREFTDARLPAVEQQLGAAAPIYPEFESCGSSFGLERMREWLGPDDPVVRQVCRQGIARRAREPRSCGRARSRDPAVRMALWKAAQAAIDAQPGSDDRARAARRSRRARAAQARSKTRSRRRSQPRPGGHREGALRDARHERLSGRHVHAAADLRRGAGLGRERQAGRAVHRAVARLRARDRRAAVPDPGALDGARRTRST